MALLLISLLACTRWANIPATPGTDDTATTPSTSTSTTTTSETTDFADFAPGVAAMHRLTDPQFRNASEDLLGVRYDGALPGDYTLHGWLHQRGGRRGLREPPRVRGV